MIDDNNLTFSEQKTKNTIYKIIGRKISESRRSSRRKLESISKKLNISVDILKKIEEGELGKIDKEIPITGFLRAFAKITNSDISEEIDKLQSDYLIYEKPKKIYKQVPIIKTSKIFLVFLISFCFLLLFLYLLNDSRKEKEEIMSKNLIPIEEDFFNTSEIIDKENIPENDFNINYNNKISKVERTDDTFFEIIFLEETWIEIYDGNKALLESGIFNVGQSLNFKFQTTESDYYIKSGNLGGFQIFFKDEFFAPFGYSGEVNRGFYLKKKISKIQEMRL